MKKLFFVSNFIAVLMTAEIANGQTSNNNNCLAINYWLSASNVCNPVTETLHATIEFSWVNPDNSPKLLVINFPNPFGGGTLFHQEIVIEHTGPGSFHDDFDFPCPIGWNLAGTATIYKGRKPKNLCDIETLRVSIF